MKHFLPFLLALAALILTACGGNKNNDSSSLTDADSISVPDFSADSAMASIETQCAFGPRTMDSPAHERCGQYIASAFRRYGCDVTLQHATFTRYDGLPMKGYNIIAQTRPSATKRIMLCAHWDSRPWSDADPDSLNWHRPVLAANDGASGVAVMLELARLLQRDSLPYGIDFVCFDAEDAGTPDWEKSDRDDESTWCLGAQYWARHPHAKGIEYAILLDMVGGVGAHFYQEGFSLQYAADLVTRVWAAAAAAGYSDMFPTDRGGFITDDHLPLNRIASIPTIDIIPYYPTASNAFGPTWHTQQDNVANISPATLKAVGQTLLHFLFTENL